MTTAPDIASRLRQRGQVLILTGLTLIVLTGAVGLAIDTGRIYGVKARLNAAVDAAALAGARALAVGTDDTSRIANAQSAALRYFAMNYPADFLSSTAGTPSTSVVREDSGRWRVNVSATARMPTSFIRVLGPTQADVAAAAEAIRRELDVVLVMDTSGSLGPPTSSSTTFPTLKQAAINGFITRFNASTGGDRVGLVSFASGTVVDAPINRTATRGFDRTAVTNAINALPLGGATASAEGLNAGLSELNAVPVSLRSGLRVILLFSDGAPNMVNGTFRLASGSTVTGNLYSETQSGNAPDRLWPSNQRNGTNNSYTTITQLPALGSGTVPLTSFNNRRSFTGASFAQPYPYENSRCNVNKAARNMLENVANTARSQSIRVYTIGLGDALNNLEIGFCGYATASERGSTILKRVANASDADTLNATQPTGLYCYAATASDLDRCFATIASDILRLTL